MGLRRICEQSHIDSGAESGEHDSSIEEVDPNEADDADERAAEANALITETVREKRKKERNARRLEKEAKEKAVNRAKKREEKNKKEKAKRYTIANSNYDIIDTNPNTCREAFLNAIVVHVLSTDPSSSEGDEEELLRNKL